MSIISTFGKGLIGKWVDDRIFAIWIASSLTFVVRVIVAFGLGTYDFDTARDHWAFGFEWGTIARWLVETGAFSLDGTTPTADTDPLYIFVIAPFFYVFGTFSPNAAIALILLQSILCSVTTWAIFVLAEKLYGRYEARTAALLFALYPASVFFAVNRIGPSSLAALMLCVIFLAAQRLPHSRGLGISVWTGVLIGIVVLVSSDNLSLFLVVPLWLCLVGTRQRGRMFLKSSIVIIAAVTVLVPWSLRNSSVSGEPTISKANLGYHLYVGNNPFSSGVFGTSRPPELMDGGSPYKESEYYAMAISWIAQHPREFLLLTMKRIQYFWYVIDGRGHSRNELIQGWLLLILMSVAGLGALWSRQISDGVTLLWLFIAIYPLVFYFTHASFYRHRYHVEPFVLILASHGIALFWAYCRAVRLEPMKGILRTVISKHR